MQVVKINENPSLNLNVEWETASSPSFLHILISADNSREKKKKKTERYFLCLCKKSKMFDLNLSVDCNNNGKAKLVAADHSSGGHSPATSFSSVVNGDGETSSASNDDTCSTRAASPGDGTFNFDILAGSNDPADRDRGLTSAESGLVTRELFPVSRLGELNLGTRQIGVGPDHGPQRMEVQPQQQQVPQAQAKNKSRRGPRSRSSQYRGVTFYRRTGRWESHIWYNYFHYLSNFFFLN